MSESERIWNEAWTVTPGRLQAEDFPEFVATLDDDELDTLRKLVILESEGRLLVTAKERCT